MDFPHCPKMHLPKELYHHWENKLYKFKLDIHDLAHTVEIANRISPHIELEHEVIKLKALAHNTQQAWSDWYGSAEDHKDNHTDKDNQPTPPHRII